MKIKQANLGDLESATALFDAYRVFYGQPSNLALARDFIAERMRKEQSVIFLASDSDGSAVGFAQIYPSFTSIGVSKIYILNDLYVVASARRRGIASLLLEEVTRYGQSVGALRLELCTAHTNDEAKNLYEARGWQLNVDYDYYSFTL